MKRAFHSCLLVLAAGLPPAAPAGSDPRPPDNPLNLSPAEGRRDFFAEAMRFTLAPDPATGASPRLSLRLADRTDGPATLGEIDPATLAGTPATLEWSPESVEVYHFSILADRFIAGGKPALALQQLLNAENIDPGNAAVLERLARACDAAGDHARALAGWNRLEMLFPDDGDVRAARIRCLLLAGRRAEARAAAEAASARTIPRRHLLCRFYRDALRVIEGPPRPETGPHDPYTLRELSMLTRRMQGPLREADRLFGPESRAPLLDWLLGGVSGGDPDRAAVRVRQAAQAGEALWNLHVALRDGRTAGAELPLRTLDGLGVTSPWIELARAEWLAASDRRAEAVACLDRLAPAAEKSVALSLRTGELRLAFGDPVRAVELFRNAALIDRANPETLRAEFLLACALSLDHQEPAAAAILRRLAGQTPADLREWMRGDAPGVRAIRGTELLREAARTR